MQEPSVTFAVVPRATAVARGRRRPMRSGAMQIDAVAHGVECHVLAEAVAEAARAFADPHLSAAPLLLERGAGLEAAAVAHDVAYRGRRRYHGRSEPRSSC